MDTLSLEYNTERGKLLISEYGRSIQKMIEVAVAEPNKEKRQSIANEIIRLMGQLNPHLRDVVDYKHKLWDHLFVMSDFKLDVDSPYPMPTKESLLQKPDALNYPQSRIKYRFYGKNIAEIKTSEIYKGAIPFIGLQVLMICVVVAFPQLVMHYKGPMVDPSTVEIKVPMLNTLNPGGAPSLGAPSLGVPQLGAPVINP